MKIVQVIDSLTGGGAERVCLELHKQFLSSGHQSFIYITHNNTEYAIDDQVLHIPREQLLDEIEKNNFDLIIGHMTHAIKVLRSIKRRKNVFFVVHTTLSEKLKLEDLFVRIKSYIKLKILYTSSNVICVSDGVKDDLTKTLKIKPATIQTIYNPFDFNAIRKMSGEECELDFDYIISAGSLNPLKRHDLLLEVFSKLDTALHLVLLGKGKELENLKRTARELNIADRVHFIGWVSNPYKYVKNAKLFVLSSDIEGFGNVIVESLIVGTPVVSTDCPVGPREILVGGLAPFLSQPGSAEDIKAKIERALVFYPKIDTVMLQKFGSNRITDQYLSLKK